ncbi:MAG TPA: hypothetical protein V6D17_08040 [Candidatus Obscuribacterales bacterium]
MGDAVHAEHMRAFRGVVMRQVRAAKPFLLSLALLVTLGAVPSVAAAAGSQPVENNRDLLLRKSYDLMLKGKFQDAIISQRKAIAADRDSVTARRYLAYSLIQIGEPNQAVDQLTQITIMTKPTSLDMLLMGTAHLQANQFDVAERWFKEALEADPSLSLAKIGLARAASAKNQQFEAANKAAAEALAQQQAEEEAAKAGGEPKPAPAAKPQIASTRYQGNVINHWANWKGYEVPKPTELPKPLKK